MGLLALAVLAALVVVQANPQVFLLPVFLLVLVNFSLSLLSNVIARRWDPAKTAVSVLVLDVITTAVAVFYSGGLSGGFAVFYVTLLLAALFFLKRRAAILVAVISIALFFLQFILDIVGIQVFPNNPPVVVEFVGQGALLVILIVVTLYITRANAEIEHRLRDDKKNAELVQQRWALINSVTLRVQESTTPQQVYTSISEELERVKLHCAILEWAEPNVSFQIVHFSLGNSLLDFAQQQLHVNLNEFRFQLRDKPELARAVETHYPVRVKDVLASSVRLFPQIPRPLLQAALVQLDVNSIMYAPMVNQDQVSGVLLIWGKELNESDVMPLAALAQQSASALVKAHLLTEQHKRSAQLELVSRIAAQVSSAENADQIIQPLVRQVGKEFGYDIVSIVLIDPVRNDLYVAASYTTLGKLDSFFARQALSTGILGLVARTGEMYLARDTTNDPHYYSPLGRNRSAGDGTETARTDGRLKRDPIQCELAVPLRSQNQVIGVLDVESVRRNAFDVNDINAVALLANQVSAAMNKTRVLTLEQKRAAQLALVSEIAARATTFSEPEAIVKSMVELVQERFGYHHVCLSLYDAARNEMEQRSAAGPNAHLYPIGKRWSAGEGLIGLAASARRTVYSGDLNSDPRYAPDPDKLANSGLCVPLISGDQVLGVLDVESETRDAFDSNDIGAMETLANQMAAALERARSFQTERRRAAQLALVNRVASRTARLMPTEQLVREAVEMIRAQFGYFNVAVLVCDFEGSGVRLVANVGGLMPLLQENEVVTSGIIGYVAASGNTYLCDNPAQDPRYRSPFPRRADDTVQSELTIPLRRGDTVIGVLDIQSEQPNAFTPSDITALEALADQLAAALENARLFESEEQRAAQLDAVRVLSLQLTAERNLDVVLDSIVASAAELVEAEGSTLYIVDEPHGDLVVRISNSMPRSYVGYRLQVGEGLAGQVVARAAPLMVENYSTWAGRAPLYENEHFARMMGVPLKWQDRVLGVIVVHRSRELPMFNQEELRFANLFAAQAAIAMENARLLKALEARLDVQQTLSDISAALLGTTNTQAILEHAAIAARRILNSDIAIVFLPDGDRHLVMRAHTGNVPDPILDLRLPMDTSSVPGKVYTTHTAAQWNAADSQSLPNVHPLVRNSDIRAGISVPMLVGDAAVGVISVNTRSERHFDMTDVQTLALLANQTASALERARYFDQVQRRVRELDLLFEGYRATTSTLDPRQVIARLLEQLVRALDVTSGYFIRVDSGRHSIRQTHEYFSEYALPQERTTHTRIWGMDGMPEVKQVLAHEVRITQAGDRGISAQMRDYMAQHRVHTILRVPLATGENVLGYLSLWETRAPRVWSPDEVRFVQTMASQAVAALVNAELYQAAHTRTRELQTLYEASRLINTTLDTRAICENGVNALRDFLGYHHVSIYFMENGLLRLQVQRGYDTPFEMLPPDRGIAARAIAAHATILLPDVSTDPEFITALQDVQSEIAVPLIAGDRVLGVLNVETLRAEALPGHKTMMTDADEQLLTTFANQLVTALENARLLQATETSLQQVRTLHAASQAVNADLDLETVLERVAWQFVVALDVDFCTLLEFDAEHGELVTLFDLDPEPRVRLRTGERFALAQHPHYALVLDSGLPTVFRGDDPNLSPALRENLDKYLCRTELALPLVSKGRVIGLIELGDRKQVREFRPDELRLAESLTSQAAVSLANARLYRAAQQRLQEIETLYRFAHELGGTLDIQQLGERALEAAGRLTDFDIGEVSLVRESDGTLIPLVIRGATKDPLADYSLPYGEGIMGWVVEHGRTVRVGDVTRDPRYRAMSPHIMSEMCVPLRVGQRVIGALNLEAKAPNAFDAHAEELLIVFANQLAIAIENARLYEQTKRDAEVKAALLRELSHRVKNNLAAITSLLYMALDEPSETREQILGETLGRVQSMALAHGLLARSGHASVSLVDLGRQVLNDTVRNLSRPGAPIQVQAAGDSVQVGAHQTTTLALVLNELATNSLRHGLKDAAVYEMPTLRFSVSALPHEVECFLEDNGTGLPDEFAMETNAGLGLNLVRTLVEKDLHGHFRLERRAPWTRAEIRFRLVEM